MIINNGKGQPKMALYMLETQVCSLCSFYVLSKWNEDFHLGEATNHHKHGIMVGLSLRQTPLLKSIEMDS
jgi:hypothetical protein